MVVTCFPTPWSSIIKPLGVTRFTSAELTIAHDTDALLDRLDLVLTAGQLSDATRNTIQTALDATPVAETASEEAKLRQIHRAVLLVMVSNDYLVQK